MLMGKALLHRVERHPDKTAVIFGEQSWTYDEFNRRVNRLANRLTAWGLGSGHKLAVLAMNGPEFLEIYHATAKIGVCTVPLDYRLEPAEVERRLVHSEVSALFLAPQFNNLYAGLNQETKMRLGRRVAVLGDRGHGVGQGYEELLDTSREDEPDFWPDPEDILFMAYTGGTTGRSKAVLVSNRAIVAGYLYKALVYGFSQEDTILCPGPFWHTAARNFSGSILYMGGTVVIMPAFGAREFLELVQRHRISAGMLMPTMLSALLDLPDHERYDTSCLRLLIASGSALAEPQHQALLERFGPIICRLYGCTEALMVCSSTPREGVDRADTVGRPVQDVYLRLVDEDGREVPRGQVGEIYVRSPSLFSGYYKDEDGTEESMTDGWFATGDMGRLDQEGWLQVINRKTDIVICAGRTIFPGEIERVLNDHPALAEVAVIGVPDEALGEALKAVVVLKEGHEAGATEIIAHCRARLAEELVPQSVDFLPSLPRSPEGKLLTRRLRDRYWSADCA